MIPDDPQFEWLRYLGYIVLATFGGAMGYIMRALEKNEKLNWVRIAIEAAGASFVGSLVMLACLASSVPDLWIGVIVGVSGWMGASATIQILERSVFKKLGLDETGHPEQKDEEPPR